MSASGDFRRFLPPPRRRPNILTIMLRWRAEIVLAGATATVGHYGGWVALEIIAGVSAIMIAAVPMARRVGTGLFETLATPHRVRAGLIQAGVTDRDGSPPWLIWARPKSQTVWVTVWLDSGVTIDDLRGADAVVSASCGAMQVEVVRPSYRQDRAIIVVIRPRWGLPGP